MESLVKSEPKEVAQFTLRGLKETVPEEVPGIVFLSGGQSSDEAIANLNGINIEGGEYPWELSFSFGRALQGATLDAWKGEDNSVNMAQEVFFKVAEATSLARQGKYREEKEKNG